MYSYIKEKDLKKSLIIRDVQIPNNQMIINGQPQLMEITCLCCPNCFQPLINFEQKVSKVTVYKYIMKNKLNFENIHYCSNCGQKIKPLEIIDLES